MIDPSEKIITYDTKIMKRLLSDIRQRIYLADLIIQYAEAKQPIPIKLVNEYNELAKVEVQG